MKLFQIGRRKPPTLEDVVTAWKERAPFARRLYVHMEREGTMPAEPAAQMLAQVEEAEAMIAALESRLGEEGPLRAEFLQQPENLRLAAEQLAAIKSIDPQMREFRALAQQWGIDLPKGV